MRPDLADVWGKNTLHSSRALDAQRCHGAPALRYLPMQASTFSGRTLAGCLAAASSWPCTWREAWWGAWRTAAGEVGVLVGSCAAQVSTPDRAAWLACWVAQLAERLVLHLALPLHWTFTEGSAWPSPFTRVLRCTYLP